MKGPRSDSVNEEYYARNNQPSFKQLKKDYDFYDDSGRFYWIDQYNDDTFQNRALRQTPDSGKALVNSYQEVSMTVKLKTGSEWFTERDYWNDFFIVSRLTKRRFAIRIASVWRGLEKRRTCTIEVKGLNQEICDSLLLLRKSFKRVRVGEKK